MAATTKEKVLEMAKEKGFRREVHSIISTIFFLTLGFLIIWFSKNYFPLDNNVADSILLLLPIFIYMLFSGRITELKAPGGLEAKFLAISEKSLDIPDSEAIKNFDSPLDLSDPTIIDKESTQDLYNKIYFLDKSKPIFLTLKLRKNYSGKASETYIKTLSKFRTFKFIVLLREDERYLAFMKKDDLLSIILTNEIDNLVSAIAYESLEQLLGRFPFNSNKIKSPTTNIKALQEMTTNNVDAIAIVDENDKLHGVVEREDILNKVVLALIK